MKKIISILMVCILLLSMLACSATPNDSVMDNPTEVPDNTVATSENTSETFDTTTDINDDTVAENTIVNVKELAKKIYVGQPINDVMDILGYEYTMKGSGEIWYVWDYGENGSIRILFSGNPPYVNSYKVSES